jgi:hypothetical protein
MGRGYTGQSKEDLAYDKMQRVLWLNRNKKAKKTPTTLLESLKEVCPHTWKEELAKMKKEYAEQHSKSNP